MTIQMTSKERIQAWKNGEEMDRMPITLFHPDFAAKIMGQGIHESAFNPELLARREIEIYRTYEVDEVSVMYTSLPKSTTQLFIKLEDLDQLDPADFTFDQDRRQKVNYQAVQLIHQELQDEIDITYGISGPLTLGSTLIKTTTILRGMRKDPDRVHQLLKFTTNFLKDMVDKFSKLGYINYFIFEPVSSTSLLSPSQYREFSLPYTQELISHMRQYTDEIGLHICGNTEKILPDIGQTGAAAFSLDQKVDLEVAKTLIGDKMTLMGNVDPTKTLLQGSPKDIEAEVRQCYEKAWGSEKGFILRSGCGVPYDTPEENIKALVQASKKHDWVNQLEGETDE